MISFNYMILFFFSLSLCFFYRQYALKKQLIDIPNDRSSHQKPTPRGGGVAFVVSSMLGLLILSLSKHNLALLVLAGSFIAFIGFMDDKANLSGKVRLVVHFFSAVIVLWGLGGLPKLSLGHFYLDLGWWGYLLGIIGLVWLLNLYNFMDGINGIASIEALTTLSLMAIFLNDLKGPVWLINSHWILFFSVLGFLVWNFPKAKLFMGDVGSGFLGFMIGVLGLASGHFNSNLLWSWLILLGVFIIDSSFTLVRRMLKGEKLYLAHRSHAYQHAAQKYQSHIKVTLAVLMINIFWLMPWAFWVAQGKINGLIALMITYSPLLYLVIKLKAGINNPMEN